MSGLFYMVKGLQDSLEDRPHEAPFVAGDAACSLRKGVADLVFRVGQAC